MAHFAKINKDGTVEEVIVIGNDDIKNLAFPESEPIGQSFIKNELKKDGFYLQTSYNNNFRKKYAMPNFIYDRELDEFVDPKELEYTQENYNVDTTISEEN